MDCNTKAKGVFLQGISFSSEARHFEFRSDDMATYQIPTPEQMNCSGDLPTNWKMFGIATAPEEYQRRQHEVLEGLLGIYVIADDILITGQGKSKEEALKDHDRNLVALLERARETQKNPKN